MLVSCKTKVFDSGIASRNSDQLPNSVRATLLQLQSDMLELQAYRDVMGFIVAMNDAVKGKKITGDYPVSEVIDEL